MTYSHIVKGRFVSRPNRFIALVEAEGILTQVHVKNTGRCKELLRPGCTVYLEKARHSNRKTMYDLVTVEKERSGQPPLLVNLDSQLPNDLVAEWLPGSGLFFPGAQIRREVTYQNSRFDFCITEGEEKTYLEVKGVTLEKNGQAAFPDAPTLRGVKHLQELIACVKEGHRACVLFVLQMKEIKTLYPNDYTHPEFGAALRQAAQAGVRILAYDCIVTPKTVTMDAPVQVELTESISREITEED